MKKPKTEDILNMDIEDIESLSRSEISKLVSAVASTANKRIKALQSQGLTSEALIDVYKSGGKFSVKGKSKTELLNELKREKSFMQGTSTISGVKEENKSIIEKLEAAGLRSEADHLTDEDVTREFWRAMDMLRESRPALFVNDCLLYGDDVYSEIAQGKTAAEAFENITEQIEIEHGEAIAEAENMRNEWETDTGWSATF